MKSIVKDCDTHYLEALAVIRPTPWIVDLGEIEKSMHNLKRYFEFLDTAQLRFDLLYYLENGGLLLAELPRKQEAMLCYDRVIVINSALTRGHAIVVALMQLCRLRMVSLLTEMRRQRMGHILVGADVSLSG